MPWQEQTVEAQRREFVLLATQEGANIRALCRQFGISPTTGYALLERAAAGDGAELADRSRRPHTSPTRTDPAIVAQVVALRRAHPAWGGRKLHHWLRQHGVAPAPAPSTITAILHRHGLITPDPDHPRPWQRFEHAAPNELWQLDFMGHLAMTQGRLHPLTLLDDHSRYALGLAACASEQQPVVQAHLTTWFERFGLPRALLTDNGPPWGTSGAGGLTALEAWLIRLGVQVWHGRAYHPQTQGKVERLHGTIAAEVTRFQTFPDLAAAQRAFDRFRTCYNHERPHQALGDTVPARQYQASPRRFPTTLPEIVYGPDDHVLKVRSQGAIMLADRSVFVSRGLIGQYVAVRPTATDGLLAVYYCAHRVREIDLRDPDEVSTMSSHACP
jgi:transposase InsO family protein